LRRAAVKPPGVRTDARCVNEYVLLPLASCISSAMLSAWVLARDAGARPNRIGALLTGGAAVWAGFEVLWDTASDPETVLWMVRLSSLGWVAIGPIALHLFLELTGRSAQLIRDVVTPLYAISAAFFALDLATPWVHAAVVRTSWGWGYAFGPAYAPFYVFTVTCLGAALALGYREVRASASPAERGQARWLMLGIGVPLVVASVTDGILPLLGHQPPRLGTASFSFLGATIAWGFHRYGYSLLAPGTYASEILSILPEGVALLRLDGRIRSGNEGMARLAGRDARDLEGLYLFDLVPDARLDAAVALTEQECTLVSRDAGRIPVSVSTAILRDKRGNPIGLVLVARDLREITSLRSRLITSGRLAAVGQLAAGIAHEINNPITYVRANLGALRDLLSGLSDKLPAAESLAIAATLREGEELVDESLDGVDRVGAIVRDVKSFSHAGGGPRDVVELHPLLDAVLRVAAPQLGGGRAIERRYGDVPPVHGDAQELKQVFLNLVINAAQATANGEAIRIATAAAGDRVVVSIEDEGPGIDPSVMAHIFDPFFTTKRIGDGTGLGLSIAYQIVRNHGGELGVQSQPGRGTSFRVELPAASEV
jgi:PAS domain S-box-containing protein